MTAAAFDAIAPVYDRAFTQSAIGVMQRDQVWNVAQTVFCPGAQILELGCGTGHDALAFARMGVSVVACDVSAGMIAVARRHDAQIRFEVCANESLHHLDVNGFDGAFSNFASLNCSRDLRPVAAGLAEKVRPGGKLLLCVFGRFCFWEIIWFLFHANFRKAFRRFAREGAMARIGTEEICISYPSVRQLKTIFSPEFSLVRWQGIGVAVPPSCMEDFFAKRQRLLSWLANLDRYILRLPGLRAMGDHILLEFVRCAS